MPAATTPPRSACPTAKQSVADICPTRPPYAPVGKARPLLYAPQPGPLEQPSDRVAPGEVHVALGAERRAQSSSATGSSAPARRSLARRTPPARPSRRAVSRTRTALFRCEKRPVVASCLPLGSFSGAERPPACLAVFAAARCVHDSRHARGRAIADIYPSPTLDVLSFVSEGALRTVRGRAQTWRRAQTWCAPGDVRPSSPPTGERFTGRARPRRLAVSRRRRPAGVAPATHGHSAGSSARSRRLATGSRRRAA